jgi:NADH-quinone oxidoreductase subunit N
MTVNIAGVEIWGVMTPLLLAALAVGGLLLDMSVWRNRPRAIGVYTLAGLFVILFLQYFLQLYRLNLDPSQAIGFRGAYNFDLMGVFFNYLFLIAAMVTVTLSLTYFKDKNDHRGEYYVLIIIAAIGMCMMAAAHDLMILFIGLETLR